jgi:hypothetical protein
MFTLNSYFMERCVTVRCQLRLKSSA